MTERTNWGAILVIYAVGVAGALQVGRIAPAGEALTAELDLTLATLDWAVSLVTLASAGLGLAAGHLVVRRGARRILIAGTFVLAMGTLFAAMASSVPLLLLVRVLEGVGYLGIVVAAPTLIARVATPGDAPAALALWGTFFTAGLSLAAIGGGWASQTYGWRGWSGMNAAMLALVAVLIFAALPKDAHSAATSDREGLRLPS
jgi:MFS family permease